MKAEIEALHTLQIQDMRMVKLEQQLAGIPRRLEEMSKDLVELETMLDLEKKKLEQTHDFQREQDDQLANEEEHIRTSKARHGSAKTPREASAAQREVESTRQMRDTRKDELVKINEAVASAEARIATTQAGLDDLRTKVDREAVKLNADKTRLTATLSAAEESRKSLTSVVQRELLQLYERVRRRGGGIAFVPVRERRCLGCRMEVPHGMYVDLKRGTEIPNCESCGRLLFWVGHFPSQYPITPEPEAAPKPKKRAAKKPVAS